MSDTFSIQHTGTIVAYDLATGRVLHINEIFEECAGDTRAAGKAPCKADCDTICAIAERDNPDCTVATLAVTCEEAPKPDSPKSWRVDLKAKSIVVEDLVVDE